jgi:hypothetical protein
VIFPCLYKVLVLARRLEFSIAGSWYTKLGICMRYLDKKCVRKKEQCNTYHKIYVCSKWLVKMIKL